MSRNEARIKQNMNPKPGLDGMLIPMNMAVVGEKPPKPPDPPTPPANPSDNGEGDGMPDDDSRELLVRLAEVHRPMLTDRFRSVLKNENTMMKRPERARTDWLGNHEPYIRSTLIPAVDTFCSSVWCVMNSGEMPESALRAVADVTAEMASRHSERVEKRAVSGREWEPWPVKSAETWAWDEIDVLIATMTRICTEYGNDN